MALNGASYLNENILWLHELRLTDLARVGGKNSSLGEMIGNLTALGVSVPGGYATTAAAFKAFIAYNNLSKRIYDKLATLDVEDVKALTAASTKKSATGSLTLHYNQNWRRIFVTPTTRCQRQ